MKRVFMVGAVLAAAFAGGVFGGSATVAPAQAAGGKPDALRVRSLVVENADGEAVVTLAAPGGAGGVWVGGPGRKLGVLNAEYVGFYRDAKTAKACDLAFGAGDDEPFVQTVAGGKFRTVSLPDLK